MNGPWERLTSEDVDNVKRGGSGCLTFVNSVVACLWLLCWLVFGVIGPAIACDGGGGEVRTRQCEEWRASRVGRETTTWIETWRKVP